MIGVNGEQSKTGVTGVLDIIPEMTVNNCGQIMGLARICAGYHRLLKKEPIGVVRSLCDKYPELESLMESCETIIREFRIQEASQPQHEYAPEKDLKPRESVHDDI